MRFQYVVCILAIGLSIFSACQKQNIDETTTKEEENETEVVTCNLTLDISVNPDGTLNASAGNGTAPYLYIWSTGDSTSTSAAYTSGSYAVTVHDAAGCTSTDSISVSINTPPCQSFAISISDDSMGNLSVTATGGTMPYSYAWATGQTTSNITVQSNGTYLVTVTDSDACTLVDAVFVTSFGNPCGSFGVDVVENPVGTLTASGVNGTAPYAYVWSTGETSASITVPTNGIYDVMVTDAMGCATDTAYQVSAIGNPCATLTGQIIDDGAGNLTLTASGGTAPYAYAWSTGETSPSITVTTNGTYMVTITDSQGCTFTTNKFVTVNDPCFGLMFTLAHNSTGIYTLQAVTGGTPPYAYSWSNGSTNTFAVITTPGVYTVSVTDAVGCVVSEDFVVQ